MKSRNAFAIACVQAARVGLGREPPRPTPRAPAARRSRCRRGRGPASRRSGGRGSARSRRPRGRSRPSSHRGTSSGRRRGRPCRGRRRDAPRPGASVSRSSQLGRGQRSGSVRRVPDQHERDDRSAERDPGGNVKRALEAVTNWLGYSGLNRPTLTYDREDRAHDRDAERAADLAGGCSAPPSRRPPCPTGTELIAADGRRGHRQRHADAAERRARGAGPRRSALVEAREEEQRHADEEHAAAHQPAGSEPVGELPGHRREEDDQSVQGRNDAPAWIGE